MSKSNIFVLDGVRGVAAIAVVLSHAFLMFSPWMHSGAALKSEIEAAIFNSPFKFFYNGSSAVAIFFVLSGIVLSMSCLKRNVAYEYVRDAALKRYIRLGLPVFFSVMVCFLFAASGVFKANADVAKNVPLAAEFLFNPTLKGALWDGAFGAMLFGVTPYNYVLWTISVEFFGSLLVYATLALFGKDKNLLRIASFTAFIFLTFHPNDFAVFYGLFMAGVFISTFEINYKSTLKTKSISLLLLAIGLYLMGYTSASKSYQFMLSLFVSMESSGIKVSWMLPLGVGAILVITSIFVDCSVLKFLAKQPFKFFGKMSFSVYLLHPIFLALIGPYIWNYTGQTFQGSLIAFVSVTTVTIFASTIFYKFIDKKSIELSANFASFVDRVISRKKGVKGDLVEDVSR